MIYFILDFLHLILDYLLVVCGSNKLLETFSFNLKLETNLMKKKPIFPIILNNTEKKKNSLQERNH